MASSKKPVTASKSKSAKSAPTSSAKGKPEVKAPAKAAAAKATTAAIKSVSVKAAAKAPAKAEKPKAPEKAKLIAAKAPEKTAARETTKPAPQTASKTEAKPRAAAKAAAAAPKVSSKVTAAAPARTSAPKAAAKPAPSKAKGKVVDAASAPASEISGAKAPQDKVHVTPEPAPTSGAAEVKEAAQARKTGGKVSSKAAASAVPVQPVTRLAPARLAMGSSAGPAAQNNATKDDAVKAPQTTNAGKAQTAAPAPATAAKTAEKASAKPGAHRTGFKVNEFIVYPAHGVGQIIAIEEQEVAGFKLELFVINFIKDKMTLKVPLPKVTAGAIRKLADSDTVQKALDTLTGRARIKRTMWSRRAQEYEAKINSGDLQAIAEVVRDLYRSDAQPEQSYSERQLYEAALDRMAREIAAVNKLTETESLKLIESQLQKGPRRGSKAEAEAAEEDIDEEGEDGDVEEAA